MENEIKVGDKVIYNKEFEATVVQIWKRNNAPNQVLIRPDKDNIDYPEPVYECDLEKVERKD